jgi:hypothetical protein
MRRDDDRTAEETVHRRMHSASMLIVAIVTGLSACASAPPQGEEEGLHIRAKANKHYLIDDRMLSFTELETLLKASPPARIVVEYSRQPAGAACVLFLGTQLGIPVWTRTSTGRMHHAHFNGDPPAFNIDACR